MRTFPENKSRRTFIKNSGMVGAGLLCGIGCTDQTGSLIQAAGNAHREKERYSLLTTLYDAADTPATLKEQLEALLPLVDDWANGKEKAQSINDPEKSNNYLESFISPRTVNFDNVFPESIPESSLLYPIWCLYRGRLLIYVTIEFSGIRMNPERRDRYYQEAVKLLGIAHKAFPDNQVIGIYLGKPKPWKMELTGTQKAPVWARSQRESIERLREIIYWWIDHRQLDFGGFGGGWNDDCEMWRWWAPLMIGFEDPKIIGAQEQLSKAMLSREQLKTGYTTRMTDVEHSAEETSDVITPMMHLKPNAPYWQQAALKLYMFSTDLWGGVNEQGRWQFKSSYFNALEVDMDPTRTVDTHYHFRLMQPLLLYWQRTHDKELTKFFQAWMDNWLAASLSTAKGKPKGIVPSAVHWPDGLPGGLKMEDWWAPGNYSSPIYDWPNGVGNIATILALTYHITGQREYLEPIEQMVKLRGQYRDQGAAESALTPGSAEWCADQLGSILPEPLVKYRSLSGDNRYDQLLLRDADGYVQYRLDGDFAKLEQALQFFGGALQHNFEIYTSEVRHTDRVLAFNDNYWQEFDESVPSTRNIANLLYKTVTGDLGGLSYFPMNAVRWKTKPENIAALVTECSTTRFSAELFHFGQENRSLEAELYLLEAGEYQFELISESEAVIKSEKFMAEGPSQTVSLELPPEELCRLRIELTQT